MKRGTPKHPKVFALAAMLKVRRPTAIGYLELLWHMCAEYTPQGNIGKYPDKWIEASLDWGGRPGYLIDCLVATGWLDREPLVYEDLTTPDPLPIHSEWVDSRKLFVHDWHDHADSAVHKRLERLHLPFLTFTKKVTRQSMDTDQLSAASRAPVPVPSLAARVPVPDSGNPQTPSVSASDDARVSEGCALVSAPSKNGNGRHPEWFAQWWAIYWRKVARKPAEKAFNAHVKTEARFAEVMAATKAQSPTMMARESNHRPHGATWLNAERWNDEVFQPPLNGPNPKLIL